MRLAEEIRFLILAAQREGNRQLAQQLRPLGITPSQAEVLRLLAEREPLTLNGLGALLVCEAGSNPSRLVDRLVTAGLVRRAEAAHDRRHVELTLTTAGRETTARVAGVEEAMYRRIDEAVAEHGGEAVRASLWALVAGEPSGRALALRK
jgi:MarR family transcriptional regulator, organic hydroperoxide resistance regulator